MDEFIDCLKEALSSICGQEAGDWIYTAKQIYFGPTKKQLRCSDTRMYCNGWLVIASQLIALRLQF